MAEFPAMPWWTDRYLADTRHLDRAQHGSYMLLLMEAWRRPRCSLPDDDAILARLAGCTEDEWRAEKAVVMTFWTLDRRRKEWVQKGQLKERAFVENKRQSQRDKARKRWDNEKKGDAPAMPKPCPDDAPTPTPTVEEREGKPSLAHPPVGERAKPVIKFAEFWDAYPHRGGLKKGRAVAEKRFAAAVKRGTTSDAIIAGAKAAHSHPDVIRGYARDPATWLSQEGWLDEFGSSSGSPGSNGYWTSMGFIPEAAE